MGLDITAYRKLTPATDAPLDSDGYLMDGSKHVLVRENMVTWSNEAFGAPPRAEGVAPGAYRFQESMGFRAGSYSGYGLWRNWLATMAGHRSARHVWDASRDTGRADGAFAELLNFADNEGIIGPKVSAKLVKDFADHEAEIRKKIGMGPPGDNDVTGLDEDAIYNFSRYIKWKQAFEMAADGGMVVFH